MHAGFWPWRREPTKRDANAEQSDVPVSLLLEKRASWRREVSYHCIGTILISLGSLVLCEVIGNGSAIGRRASLHHLSIAEWNLTLGITSSDATAVVLAMLGLVASINIAVAVSPTASRDLPPGDYQEMMVHVWATAMVTAARVASVMATVMAGTQLADGVLGGALLACAIFAVFMAVATTERERSRLPFLIEKQELVENRERLVRAVASLAR
jgi:hypothetical protein